MKFPFLASFILLCIVVNISMRRVSRKTEEREEEFWQTELKSNNVRKKSLDELQYVHIPVDQLPFDTYGDDDVLKSAEEELLALKDEKIVNLTGITNTDLKLEYGTANITVLTQYDQNYTAMVIALQKWGQELYNQNRFEDATAVLEFALKTRTDISGTYRLLVDMYKTKLGYNEAKIKEKLEAMLPIAKDLNALSRQQILNLINSNLEPSATE